MAARMRVRKRTGTGAEVVLVEAQIFYNWSIDPVHLQMDWSIRQYAVHSSICSSFTNGLKWQLDCMKSFLQNKGVHRYYLSASPSASASASASPSLSPIAVAYQSALWPTGNSDEQ